MTTVLTATEEGLGIARRQNRGWQSHTALEGMDCQCVAFDPHQPGRAYCGGFGMGLWRTDDGGDSWQPVAEPVPEEHVMSVAVSPLVAENGFGLLFAGTEPSRLFVSADGGASWQERDALQELPSKPTWSFPPRPWTHHTRWIEPDATDPERLFVGIELGGVMRSPDGGETFEDRKPGSQHDCHTLRTHPDAPGVVYEAAGGGFAQSEDGGQTWRSADAGMAHHYVWGLAVDPGDAQTLVASAASGAHRAHSNSRGDAHIYRRTNGDNWQEMRAGLPGPEEVRVYVLATNPAESGVFYALTGSRLFQSADAGQTWQEMPIDWPGGWSSKGANGLAVLG